MTESETEPQPEFADDRPAHGRHRRHKGRRWRARGPSSIAGRAILALIIATLVWVMITVGFFWHEHRSALIALWSGQYADRVAETATAVASAPPQLRDLVAGAASDRNFWIWIGPPVVEAEVGWGWRWRAGMVRQSLEGLLDPALLETVRVGLHDHWRPEEFLQLPPPHVMPNMDGQRHHMMRPWRRGVREIPVLALTLQLDDGRWLNYALLFGTSPSFGGPVFLLPLLLAGVLVVFATLWATRRATQPLSRFTAAAERLGRDVNAPPLAEDGPPEVRRAAEAFNGMQRRLAGYIRDRTQMLAAISHDLRTPITRLKLRAEFVDDDEQRLKMLADLDEMEAMIAATLSFARDDAANEPARPLDLAALLQTLCADQTDAGHRAEYQGPDHFAFEGRPMALKRAFANVIGNAILYGQVARVTLRETRVNRTGVADVVRVSGERRSVQVLIDDEGPGLPAEDLERVFDPFYRGEPSRNRATGGTGLGLSVVRSVVRAHGGSITLHNRAEGGLRVVLTLPIAGQQPR